MHGDYWRGKLHGTTGAGFALVLTVEHNSGQQEYATAAVNTLTMIDYF